MKTVFRFKVFFDDDINDIQYRYVSAKSYTEAWDKMERYRNNLFNRGFAYMTIVGEPEVEVENVID